MSTINFDFEKRFTKAQRAAFVSVLKTLQAKIPFKVSSRGWCYLMEQDGYINKSQFDKVSEAVNKCIKEGILPVDFVAADDARMFTGVESFRSYGLKNIITWQLNQVLNGYHHFIPDWWEDEKYYIQMIVEKTDLTSLFEPVCAEYKIPIANAKGWSSILQRAEYARRFKEAEDNGLQCVLLYCGDHDPDGLRISETIRKNIDDVSEIIWQDGQIGYNPQDLIIERFGLNYEDIIQQNYTWIDNLITGSSKNLASPAHPNYKLEYVQDYLKTIGERKCESNVLVTNVPFARQLCRDAINNYYTPETLVRFEEKRASIKERYDAYIEENGLAPKIKSLIKNLKEENE